MKSFLNRNALTMVAIPVAVFAFLTEGNIWTILMIVLMIAANIIADRDRIRGFRETAAAATLKCDYARLRGQLTKLGLKSAGVPRRSYSLNADGSADVACGFTDESLGLERAAMVKVWGGLVGETFGLNDERGNALSPEDLPFLR